MQGSIGRRTLIKRFIASATGVSPVPRQILVASSTLPMFLATRSSRAQVAEAFMLASAVSGLISSSSNKSGGSIGAMLYASLEYQRILSNQLLDIQSGLANVLLQISKLKDELKILLKQDRLVKLQDEIGGCIRQYQSEVKIGIDSFGNSSYQAWANDRVSISNMQFVSHRLDAVISLLGNGSAVDAATAIYIPPAMFASLGALSYLGQPDSYLRAKAQGYLDLMQMAMDRKSPNSIASAIDIHAEGVKEKVTSLRQYGLDIPQIIPYEQSDLLLGSVQVQHYLPEQPEVIKCTRGNRHVAGGRGGAMVGLMMTPFVRLSKKECRR